MDDTTIVQMDDTTYRVGFTAALLLIRESGFKPDGSQLEMHTSYLDTANNLSPLPLPPDLLRNAWHTAVPLLRVYNARYRINWIELGRVFALDCLLADRGGNLAKRVTASLLSRGGSMMHYDLDGYVSDETVANFKRLPEDWQALALEAFRTGLTQVQEAGDLVNMALCYRGLQPR